ncbi:hypothetical protein [Spiroplasma turonicum]|uniref:Lipoprotein n=1 Tax=Spiroplasma turonicum TaxID=216946 RepID=A0A0K1P8U4_9MOLU|nr:hypothetical protein [Spiroplasma turonicum]AKU80317.1 hypothetical protein STURON_001071 [Spiroplasma turonicum]ALX71318.1 hypothetical protein STURO_v1c10670 [Spiroplasma turonicum]
MRRIIKLLSMLLPITLPLGTSISCVNSNHSYAMSDDEPSFSLKRIWEQFDELKDETFYFFKEQDLNTQSKYFVEQVIKDFYLSNDENITYVSKDKSTFTLFFEKLGESKTFNYKYKQDLEYALKDSNKDIFKDLDSNVKYTSDFEKLFLKSNKLEGDPKYYNLEFTYENSNDYNELKSLKVRFKEHDNNIKLYDFYLPYYSFVRYDANYKYVISKMLNKEILKKLPSDLTDSEITKYFKNHDDYKNNYLDEVYEKTPLNILNNNGIIKIDAQNINGFVEYQNNIERFDIQDLFDRYNPKYNDDKSLNVNYRTVFSDDFYISDRSNKKLSKEEWINILKKHIFQITNISTTDLDKYLSFDIDDINNMVPQATITIKKNSTTGINEIFKSNRSNFGIKVDLFGYFDLNKYFSSKTFGVLDIDMIKGEDNKSIDKDMLFKIFSKYYYDLTFLNASVESSLDDLINKKQIKIKFSDNLDKYNSRGFVIGEYVFNVSTTYFENTFTQESFITTDLQEINNLSLLNDNDSIFIGKNNSKSSLYVKNSKINKLTWEDNENYEIESIKDQISYLLVLENNKVFIVSSNKCFVIEIINSSFVKIVNKLNINNVNKCKSWTYYNSNLYWSDTSTVTLKYTNIDNPLKSETIKSNFNLDYIVINDDFIVGFNSQYSKIQTYNFETKELFSETLIKENLCKNLKFLNLKLTNNVLQIVANLNNFLYIINYDCKQNDILGVTQPYMFNGIFNESFTQFNFENGLEIGYFVLKDNAIYWYNNILKKYYDQNNIYGDYDSKFLLLNEVDKNSLISTLVKNNLTNRINYYYFDAENNKLTFYNASKYI